jgi:hypothetical protein
MKLFLTTLILFSVNAAAFCQNKTLLPDQQRLEIFEGRWTVEGSEATYVEVCRRIQGGHIQCISASSETTPADSAVSYLSYLPIEKTYVYYGLYSSGNSRTLRGKWETDRFIFEGQRTIPDKTTRWRVTIIPEGKRMRFIEEASVNNAAWETRGDFYYKRVL